MKGLGTCTSKLGNFPRPSVSTAPSAINGDMLYRFSWTLTLRTPAIICRFMYLYWRGINNEFRYCKGSNFKQCLCQRVFLYLFTINCLIKDVSNSGYVASSDMISDDTDLGRMRMEAFTV